jgi:hypothetical protein
VPRDRFRDVRQSNHSIQALKILKRPHGHSYQHRLLFNTTSVTGLLVFHKLRRGTGIQEILFCSTRHAGTSRLAWSATMK